MGRAEAGQSTGKIEKVCSMRRAQRGIHLTSLKIPKKGISDRMESPESELGSRGNSRKTNRAILRVVKRDPEQTLNA